MLGRRSATILSIFMTTVMLGSIIAVTMPSSYVQGSDNNDIKKLELSTIDTQVDTKRLAKVNLPFIENNGQTHEDVKYYTSTFAGNAFVTEDHITYSLMKSSPKEEDGENQIQGVALKESFLTKEALQPRGLDRSDSIVNYFVGAEENWRSNIPTYNAVSLGELWPYVDVELKAYGANIEKIFKVYPGGSVEDIRLSLGGVLSLNVNEEGELILETELGDLAMTKPVAFQDIDGVQKDVEAFYLVEGSTYGFAVGDYDPHYPLVIDPLLASTFVGGGGDDRGFAIALDSSDNVFVTGFTGSSDYPTTTGAFDETHNGSLGVFVTKLKNDLSGPLLASTFIGGGGNLFDFGIAIALDSSDNVFVTGFTGSSDYPTTTGAFDETHNAGRDVFVTKLKNDLSGPLLASTIIGGEGDDRGLAIVLDSSGNLLVAGLTTSSNYPTTTGAFDETYNGSLDVFVTKLTGDLSLMEATAEPHTTIDSAVDGNSIVVLDGGSTISDSMTFTFSGTDDSGVASFECDIDIGGFSACDSPLDLTSLSNGFHNFMVRAIDNSGNTDSTPASFSWTISPVSAGDILVTDLSVGTGFNGALFRVDPTIGNRTIISDFGNAAQGALGSFPSGVAINTSGDILVIDTNAGTSSLGALFTVDPSSGNRAIISDFGNAAQGALGSFPSGVALDTSGEILVIDSSVGTRVRGALFTVDPSGNRTIISDFGNATQGALGREPVGVAIFPSLDNTTPPTITAPADITEECNTANGAAGVDLGTPTVSDDTDPNPTVTSDAPATFPLGSTTVTYTATDSSGNSASDTQTVTVEDTSPPSITAPPDIMVEANTQGGATGVNIGIATASDICDPSLTITNDAPSVFPLGDTSVRWTATDTAGNSATATQLVTVVDNTPPDVTASLIPVNNGHDDGLFRVEISASDFSDPNPTITAHINGIPVQNGQLVQLELDDDDEMEVEFDDGILNIEAASFTLTAIATDTSDNTGTAKATPTF